MWTLQLSIGEFREELQSLWSTVSLGAGLGQANDLGGKGYTWARVLKEDQLLLDDITPTLPKPVLRLLSYARRELCSY